jgi:hypothetical protein
VGYGGSGYGPEVVEPASLLLVIEPVWLLIVSEPEPVEPEVCVVESPSEMVDWVLVLLETVVPELVVPELSVPNVVDVSPGGCGYIPDELVMVP